jgi:hypothetical protein
VIGAQQRWRELRAQGAQLDAAARGAAPPRRRLEAVPEKTSAAKPLGMVLVVSPSYSITTEGLKKVLEDKAEVRIGGESSAGSPSCVVLYAGAAWRRAGAMAWHAFVNAIRACRFWCSVRSWILGWPGPR